jgi:phosphoglycerate kinase
MKKTVRDVDVSGKRVLVRVDFNVPLENGKIVDDARIRAALPTIQYLLKQRARVILLSHLNRPDGFVNEKYRMNIVAERLADLLRMPVIKINNSIGPEVHDAVQQMLPGQVLMLENVRFHPGEVVNDLHFAARLSSFADLFVNDAFASAHRAHASTTGVARFLPAVAGLLMHSELIGLNRIRSSLQPPLVVICGGMRLADKIEFIHYALVSRANILLGGVVANTFLRAKGVRIGQSEVEVEAIGLARDLLAVGGNRLHLPSDVVVADSLAYNAATSVVPVDQIPSTSCIVDIGPRSVSDYIQILSNARTVIWNGPVGISEVPAFARGSIALAKAVSALTNATTIAGGAHTSSVLQQSGESAPVDYLSTGGAAFLAALQGHYLPGIAILEEKVDTASQLSSSERISQ